MFSSNSWFSLVFGTLKCCSPCIERSGGIIEDYNCEDDLFVKRKSNNNRKSTMKNLKKKRERHVR